MAHPRSLRRQSLTHTPPCASGLQVPAIEPRPRGAFGQRFPQNAPSLPSSSSSSSLPAAAAAGGGRGGSARKLPHLAPRVDSERLGPDGLPHVGAVVWPGQALYTTRDLVTGKYKAHKLKGEEVAHIEQVGDWRGQVAGGGGSGA
jgi:hypothetical protein